MSQYLTTWCICAFNRYTFVEIIIDIKLQNSDVITLGIIGSNELGNLGNIYSLMLVKLKRETLWTLF